MIKDRKKQIIDHEGIKELSATDLKDISQLLAGYRYVLLSIEEADQQYYLLQDKKGRVRTFSDIFNKHLTASIPPMIGESFGFIVPQPNLAKEEVEEHRQWASQEVRTSQIIHGEFTLLTHAVWQNIISNLKKTEHPSLQLRESDETLQILKEDILSYFLETLSDQDIEILPIGHFIDEESSEKTLPDYVLIKKTPTLEFAHASMIGWKAPNSFSQKYDTPQIYSHICAICVVDDAMSIRKRKDHTRQAASHIRTALKDLHPIGVTMSDEKSGQYGADTPFFTVLNVDRQLLEWWREHRDSPLASEEEILTYRKNAPQKEQLDYGFPEIYLQQVKAPEVNVHYFTGTQGPRIGDYHLTSTVKYDDVTRAVLIDHGWNFSEMLVMNRLGWRPQYSEGIYPFFRANLFEPIRRLYRTDLLLLSLNPALIKKVIENPQPFNSSTLPPEELIVLDLFHRLGWEILLEYIQEKMPTTSEKMELNGKHLTWLREYLTQRSAYIYKDKTLFDAHLLTHIHQDHAVGSSLTRPNIPRGGSEWTRAAGLTDFEMCADYFVAETLARKVREAGEIGNMYPVEEYPYITFRDGERYEVAPDIFITAFETEHSIPGTMAYLQEIYHHKKLVTSILFCGDYKNGNFLKKVAEVNPRIGLAVIEGTNPPSVQKESAGFTEEKVIDNFHYLFQEKSNSDELIAIDLVKNNTRRLEGIVEVAIAQGRTPVLSPRILLRILKNEARMRKVGLREIAEELLSAGIMVWIQPSNKLNPKYRVVYDLFEHGNQDVLAANPSQYVLIRESSENAEKLQGLPGPLTWVWSAYGSYDDNGKQEANYRKNLAKSNGWEFRSKGFHASGHMPLKNSTDDPEHEGALAQLELLHPESIAVQHTFKPGEVAQVLRTYPVLANARIIFQHAQGRGGKIHVA